MSVLMAAGALCVVASGCNSSSSEVVDSKVSLTYELKENGCSTGQHRFTSLADYCSGLQKTSLNQGCAESLRRVSFTQRGCSGTFRPDATPSLSKENARASGPVLVLGCTTQALKKVVIEGYKPDHDVFAERKSEFRFSVHAGESVDLWATLRGIISDADEKELGSAIAEVSSSGLHVRSELAVIGTRAEASAKLGELLTLRNADEVSGRTQTVECRLSSSEN